jgi:2-keto-3-deoxy-L-rhamnonate aldolase RhmA
MKSRPSVEERLSTQIGLIGLLQTHPNAMLSEMAGLCGYDFLMLDCEHGWFSDTDLLQTLQAIGGSSDIAALIRLRGHDTQAIGRYMDMGADGIIVPNVSSAEQARQFARAMHYPPAGTRGLGAVAHRITHYGLRFAAHLKAPREGTCLLVIIESALGVENAADILSVEGVDGVIIGPGDLTADLGCPGDYSQPAYVEALARVEHAATSAGKWLGIPPQAGNSIDALTRRGHRMFIVGGDVSLIRDAMSAQVTKARASLEAK